MDKTNTPDEIVDLVNENDSIIGTSTKKVVNSNPQLIHREIAVIIYDDKNRILVQKRSKKKLIDPGLWTISVAGHVPSGMAPLDAAEMELMEELGLKVDLEFIEKLFLSFDNETYFEHVYKGKYQGETIAIEKEEVEEVKFVDKNELEDMIKKGEKVEEYSLAWMKKLWNGLI